MQQRRELVLLLLAERIKTISVCSCHTDTKYSGTDQCRDRDYHAVNKLVKAPSFCGCKFERPCTINRCKSVIDVYQKSIIQFKIFCNILNRFVEIN